jgi:uncharacterized membrane protein
MNRKSLLAAFCLLAGSLLITLGGWDYANPNQINHWWAGEPIYSFYWNRLALTLTIVLPLCLLFWLLGTALRSGAGDAPVFQRGQHAAWGFAAAFAVPIILLLKYRVNWLGINYGSSVWTYALVLVLSAIVTWLLWPALQRTGPSHWLSQQGPALVFAAIMAYVLVLGGLSVAQYVNFRTDSLELSLIDQALWNTSRGRSLEYTPPVQAAADGSLPVSPQSRLAGGQMELILLPLALLSWLFDDLRGLVALQTILLASGAIPLYQLARARLEDGTAALLISLAYLLYLPLHQTVLAGFQTAALMVPFLLWAWQAAEQGYWRSYYLAIGIALTCRIDAAFALLGMGAYLLVKQAGHRRHGALTLGLGLAWLVLDVSVVVPLVRNAYGADGPGWFSRPDRPWGHGPLEMAGPLLGQPFTALRLFLEREKLQTLVDLMAALGWTPFLAPLTTLAAVPVLIFDLATADPGEGLPLAPYFAPVIPFLFVAVVQGVRGASVWLARLSRRTKRFNISSAQGIRPLALFALSTSLLTTLLGGPKWLPGDILPPGWYLNPARYYEMDQHERALERTLEVVPAEVVVSAQGSLLPHLSRRPVIYLFPTIADAEFVVLDLDYSASKAPLDEILFQSTLDGLLADPTFHVAAFDTGVLVLKRGPGQAPPAFAETLADYRGGLYRSAMVEYRGPVALRAGHLYQTQVLLENRGTQSWETDAPYPIYLSYHWWAADGSLVEWNGVRNSLQQAIKPDEVAQQQVRLISPATPGDYVLEWDLVHDRRAWFSDRGGITLRVNVVVE